MNIFQLLVLVALQLDLIDFYGPHSSLAYCDGPVDGVPVAYDGQHSSPVYYDCGPVFDGPVDDGPVVDGLVDDGPVDEYCSEKNSLSKPKSIPY